MKKNKTRRARQDIKKEVKKSPKKLLIALGVIAVVLLALVLSFLLMTPSIDERSNPFDESGFMNAFGKKNAYNFETVYRYFREPTLGTVYTLADFFGSGSLVGEKTDEIIRNKNEYNILVVGKDRVGSNTDVIMVVNFDAATQEINILQIPRDTYVEDPINVGQSKRINAVYAFAYMKNIRSMSHSEASHESVKYLEGTIEDTFGITIDNYFMIDLNGFVKIIDSIGGVKVDVPFDMYYNDEAQNLHIDLKKGVQVLDGNKSEQFVRFRNTYVLGDLGRVSAQKIYLSALVEKLLSPEWFSIDSLTGVASNLIKYSTTGVSLTDIVGYLKKIDFGKLSDDSITFYTAPGESFFTAGGASMYTLYMKENLEIINKAFNLYNVDVTEKHVTLSEQMKSEYNVVDTDGLTAKDIENDQPNIIVARPKPVTPPSTDPVEGEGSTEGETPVEGEDPIEGEDPVEGENSVEGGEPVEGEEPVEGDESVEGDEPLEDGKTAEDDPSVDEPMDWSDLVESGEIVPEEPTEDTYIETERIEIND